ncbi:MAG TPA: hypothetical protein VFW56_08410 [Bradyrhizobium sp.]|nr:hypothetical protein [Bradyrhizobium sp.]
MSFVTRYVGIPYADRGHGFDGCNCWGLVHLVLKEEAGIVTPVDEEISARDALRVARVFRDATATEVWREVPRERVRPFDCVLMRSLTEAGSRVENHVGIVVPVSAGLNVLHVWQATAACLMPFDHLRIRNRIARFYRHRDLE